MTRREFSMYKARLLKLADFLTALPPKRFDLERWVGDTWGGAQDLSCGTTACALGWAATMPAFRRLGLRLVPYCDDLSSGEVVVDGYTGVDAAHTIFGLSQREAAYLFVPRSRGDTSGASTEFNGPLAYNTTAKQVAAHIRKFVKNWAPVVS